MKRRDRTAVMTFRGALAAIDNAEAIPLAQQHRTSAIELSPKGAGSTDVPRRSLTESDLTAILRTEAEEHRAAAGEVSVRDAVVAERLHEQAELIEQLLTAYEAREA